MISPRCLTMISIKSAGVEKPNGNFMLFLPFLETVIF
jgi:hypothetical protein